MNRTLTRWLARLAVAGFVAAVWTGSAWSQVPEAAEPIKNKTQPAADAAKQAVPKAGSSAKEAADDVPGAAREAAGEARRGAEDAAKGAKREGREAVRDGQKAAREGAKEGREAVREGAREGREALREGRESIDNLRSADLGLWFDSSATAEGLVISDIAAEGAITKLGFQEGDRIVSINDTPVRSEREFVRLLLADDLRNERVRVVVIRDGREQVVLVQPALIYQEVVAYDPLWQYGIVVDDRYPDRIVLLRVYPRTPAYYAGLRAGDVITTIGGRRIAAVADFTRALSAADGRLALEVNRANRTRQVALDTSSVTEGRTRATLRPEIGAEGAVEGRTEGRVEGRTEGRVKGRTEGRVEGRTEGKAKGRVEKSPAEGDDAPTPRPRLEKQPKQPGPRVETPDLPESAPASKTPKAPAAPKTPAVPKL